MLDRSALGGGTADHQSTAYVIPGPMVARADARDHRRWGRAAAGAVNKLLKAGDITLDPLTEPTNTPRMSNAGKNHTRASPGAGPQTISRDSEAGTEFRNYVMDGRQARWSRCRPATEGSTFSREELRRESTAWPSRGHRGARSPCARQGGDQLCAFTEPSPSDSRRNNARKRRRMSAARPPFGIPFVEAAASWPLP